MAYGWQQPTTRASGFGWNSPKFKDYLAYGATDPMADANTYRNALMGGASRDLASGLGGIQGFLSTQGPLGDSGARAALGARLAGGIYGKVGNQYAQYLAQALAERRNQAYRLALLRAQHQYQQTGIGGFLGGAAGAFGGPLLGAWGKKIGEGL